MKDIDAANGQLTESRDRSRRRWERSRRKTGEQHCHNSWSRRLTSISGQLLLLALLVLPLTFGAVHPRVIFLVEAITFVVLLTLCTARFKSWTNILDQPSHFRIFVGWFVLFLIVILAQYGLSTLNQIEHPVLGTISVHPAPDRFWARYRSALWFLASFSLFAFMLHESRQFARHLPTIMIVAGVLVSAIALSHWFYDNGRLFWVFAPDYVFTSTRARWPFVNSNHLGHYLATLSFIVLARLFLRSHTIVRPVLNMGVVSMKAALTRLIGTKSQQSLFTKILLLGVGWLMMITAIAGTLSRGTWLALAIGLLIFLLMDRGRTKTDVPPSPQPTPKIAKQHHSNRRQRSHRTELPTRTIPFSIFIKPLLFTFALLLFMFFLYGRGAELIQGRIEYGLTHSKDDMRWTFYSDSRQMLQEHPLVGIGLGAWQVLYPRYMNELLANVKPAYLHSDPMELLIEVGVLGALPLILLSLTLFVKIPSAISKLSSSDRLMLTGVSSALITLLIASIMDFPLRIPAILFYCSALCAQITFYLDEAATTTETDENKISNPV